MNNNLTNWQNVRCESNNNCVSNKCFNYYAGGTKYCWPKKKCDVSGAICYGTTNVGLYNGKTCRYDKQCNSGDCSGNRYGIRNGKCD
jgi:hypothetical protein